MITRALNLRRSGSRRPRPSRFPAPGFPRGASAEGRWVGVPAQGGSRPQGAFLSARSTRQVRTIDADLFAALVMVGGIFVWGGLFVLLAA